MTGHEKKGSGPGKGQGQRGRGRLQYKKRPKPKPNSAELKRATLIQAVNESIGASDAVEEAKALALAQVSSERGAEIMKRAADVRRWQDKIKKQARDGFVISENLRMLGVPLPADAVAMLRRLAEIEMLPGDRRICAELIQDNREAARWSLCSGNWPVTKADTPKAVIREEIKAIDKARKSGD